MKRTTYSGSFVSRLIRNGRGLLRTQAVLFFLLGGSYVVNAAPAFSGDPYSIATSQGDDGWYHGFTTGKVKGLTEGANYLIVPVSFYNVDYASVQGKPAWQPWGFQAGSSGEQSFYISVQKQHQDSGTFYLVLYLDTDADGQLDPEDEQLDMAWVYVDY